MGRADLATMAEALRAAGWNVHTETGVLYADTPQGDNLVWRAGETDARITTWQGRAAIAVGNAAKRAYSQLQVTRTYAKAGIKVRSTTTDNNGRVVMRLGR